MYNDFLVKVGSGICVVLILLDISAAFDTVDRDNLIDRLKHGAGDYFASYLENRTLSVIIDNFTSSLANLSSILGPILFLTYMLLLKR